MTKEKQIEEMAKTVCGVKNACDTCIWDKEHCSERIAATVIYNTGFRKRVDAEWSKVMHHRECSKCGHNAPYKKIKAGYHLQDLTNFCPNCGAKMKGDEEE